MYFSLKARIMCIALLVTACNAAEISAKENSSPLNSIYACTSILNDSERLACFDNAVPVLQVKEKKKEIITIDAEGAKAIERDSFGFSLPSLPKLGLIKPRSKDVKKPAQVFKVKSLSNRRGKITLVMENNQVWQQTSGDIGYIPKGDLTAKIKPASLGSFFISLTNQDGDTGRKGVRVKRIK